MTRKISTGINSLESVKIWNKEMFCFFWEAFTVECVPLETDHLTTSFIDCWQKVNKYFEAGWCWKQELLLTSGCSATTCTSALCTAPAQCTALQWERWEGELGRLQPKRRQWRGNQKLIKDLKPGARKAWEVEDKGKKHKIATRAQLRLDEGECADGNCKWGLRARASCRGNLVWKWEARLVVAVEKPQ